MHSGASVPVDASARSEAADGDRRGRLGRALRLAPTLAALTLWSALIGACGRSIFPFASTSPTPTATITTSPTTGNFLYSSNFSDGKVAEFSRNLSTGALALIGSVGAGSASGPIGIANGPSAKFLYVANSADGNVHEFKINSTSGKLTAISGNPVAAGVSPQWIAVTPNARFAFVANFGDGSISPYTVDTTTGALTANGSAVSSILLSSPTAAVASNSFLYVTDSTKGTIVSFPIGANGTLSAGSSTTLTGNMMPGPVIMDQTGQFVYVSDQKLGQIYFLKVGTGVLTFQPPPLTASLFAGEGGLAVGTTTLGREFLFVANQVAVPPTISVFLVNAGGTLGSPVQYPTIPDGLLNLPTGLVVDPTGSFLYVANQGNGTISRFTINATTGALGTGVAFATESATSKPLFLSISQ
jgi:6-phosphogluconolactonase (cycloisomerase 2 family)